VGLGGFLCDGLDRGCQCCRSCLTSFLLHNDRYSYINHVHVKLTLPVLNTSNSIFSGGVSSSIALGLVRSSITERKGKLKLSRCFIVEFDFLLSLFAFSVREMSGEMGDCGGDDAAGSLLFLALLLDNAALPLSSLALLTLLLDLLAALAVGETSPLLAASRERRGVRF
jgi:hypothetical protein